MKDTLKVVLIPILTLALLLTAFAISSGPVRAGGIPTDEEVQGTSTHSRSAPVDRQTLSQESSTAGTTQTSDQNSVSGKVVSYEGEILTLNTDQGTKAFIVKDNVNVIRNDLGSHASSLKPGDSVTLRADQNGSVMGIDAASNFLADIAKIAAIGAVSILLALGVTYLLTRKSRRHHYSHSYRYI